MDIKNNSKKSLTAVKFTAFSIHAALSLSIFLSFLALAAYVWYPDFYFAANGVWLPMLTIAFVDVGLGPILTLVLYKPGKPGLKFDLSMIVVFQLLAICWGAWVLYSQRPLLTVYENGVFYCLPQEGVISAQADLNRFQTRSGENIALAYLPPPRDAAEGKEREQRLEELPDGSTPIGAYVFGDKFEPVGKANLENILMDEVDIAPLTAQKIHQAAWSDFQSKHGAAAEKFAYYPLVCGLEEHTAAMQRDTGILVDSMSLPSITAKRKRLKTKETSQ